MNHKSLKKDTYFAISAIAVGMTFASPVGAASQAGITFDKDGKALINGESIDKNFSRLRLSAVQPDRCPKPVGCNFNCGQNISSE